ncbi:MAG: MFS transporter [Halioglobus sp.]|nr:MFS transporter [Halioglobus sp.]
MNILLSVTSLLLSTALLLIGHGMQLTLLPLRATEAGMASSLIGLSASCYFIGFAAGCFGIPPVLARIGHIRAFAVLAALMISAILCLEMIAAWPAWLVLRFVTGIAMSGLYAVIESWLNNRATQGSRGRILALYTFISLFSLTAGQLLINVGPVQNAEPFMLAALCMALAILPIGLTRRLAPEPVEPTHTGFSLLVQRSGAAFAGALLSGLMMGSFWSLGALFARQNLPEQIGATTFMSVALAGGALMQYPIGWLSDRIDRRRVLLLLCLGAAFASLAVAAAPPQPWLLPAVFLFGATAMPLYAISLATAADVCEWHEFVEIGTTVLMLNAVASAVAPLALGPLMTRYDDSVLFTALAATCAGFAVYFTVNLRTPRSVSVEAQRPFEPAVDTGAPTGFELDPRTEETIPDPDTP